MNKSENGIIDTLTTIELSKIFSSAIAMLESYGIEEIKILPEDSWYLKVWHKNRTFDENPRTTMGEVYEDMEALHKITKGDMMFPYDLERLGAFLTIVGTLLNKEKI